MKGVRKTRAPLLSALGANLDAMLGVEELLCVVVQECGFAIDHEHYIGNECGTNRKLNNTSARSSARMDLHRQPISSATKECQPRLPYRSTAEDTTLLALVHCRLSDFTTTFEQLSSDGLPVASLLLKALVSSHSYNRYRFELGCVFKKSNIRGCHD